MTRLAKRSMAALRKHPKPGLKSGESKSRQAAARKSRRGKKVLVGEEGKVGSSFSEVVKPGLETDRTAQKSTVEPDLLNKMLNRRAVELTAVNARLQKGVTARNLAERGLRKSGERAERLLGESRQRQKQLQHQTHRIISKQEAMRKKISCSLHDEIAQTLLGINVYLLALQKRAKCDAKDDAKGFKKDVAKTQRLVEESTRSITRLARSLNLYPQK